MLALASPDHLFMNKRVAITFLDGYISNLVMHNRESELHMPALLHFRKSGKSGAKLIFAENLMQNFAFLKNYQVGDL